MGELVFSWTATIAVIAIATVTQRRSGTIPNALTLPTLAVAPLVHVALGADGLRTVAAVAVSLVVGLAGFRWGLVPGGAAKLFWAACATGGIAVGLASSVLAAVAMATSYAVGARIEAADRAAGRPPKLREKFDLPPVIAALVLPGLLLESWALVE